MKKELKTNVMRILEKEKVPYEAHYYPHGKEAVDGACNLEEKGVKERREQQITERNEGRADERGTSTEANAVVKDAGKADRKQVQQKQAVVGKDKKLSIHERLEINKRIIQEKQGKDKPERGADRGVR